MTDSKPDVTIRWFHACDAPKSDTTPFRNIAPPAEGAKPAKVPTNWVAFSAKDSAAIEAAWQYILLRKAEKDANASTIPPVPTRIPVNEDQLFEVDVEKKEIYPVYWYGPTYDIRRGTWFMSPDGTKFLPCDDNLSRQLEDGYTKFKPWSADIKSSSVATHVSSSEQQANSGDVKTAPESKPAAYYKPELRWALFGPWMNSFVVFTGAGGGWLFSDQLSSKWARALMSGLTRGENQGGTRVVRSWSEVEKLQKGAKQKRKPSVGDTKEKTALDGSNERIAADAVDKAQERNEAEDYIDEDSEERQINHLILVIHGIGQKLGERLDTVNFVHDCTVLRHAIKDSAKATSAAAVAKDAQKSGAKKSTNALPDQGGAQVLPVQWRQMIDFGKRKSTTSSATNSATDLGKEGKKDGEDADEAADIVDITLDGVPSIRMLVSDVALDVLLYMTPKYRQEMVRHVTEEMNRIVRTFRERNPKFSGKISIYGHSLGSLLAFDILCNQPYSGDRLPQLLAESLESRNMNKGQSEVDLSDMLRGAINESSDRRRLNGLMERTSIHYDKLEFEVDKLFAVGSPVGLFLLLKGDRLRARKPGQVLEPNVSRPACNAVYNIFHPHDPVAYRYEPLVARSFASKKPVQIQYNKGGLTRTIVGIADTSKSIFSGIYSTVSGVAGIFGTGSAQKPASGSVGDLTPAVLTSSLNTMTGGSTTNATPRTTTSSNVIGAGSPIAPAISVAGETNSSALSDKVSSEKNVKVKASTESIEAASPAPAPLVITAADEEEVRLLNPSGRIDYVLQEGMLENAYLSSLSSHMTYWPDVDVAAFIIKELHGKQ